MAKVEVERRGPVQVVTINRPEVRNAVDRDTAEALAAAFRAFDADGDALCAVLTGAGGNFCAGADLRGIASGEAPLRLAEDGDAPLGVSRMLLSKPVIAAVEGYAVAGGLELSLWCDLRVAGAGAVFGVYCRRWGVPLVDGGTVRLPRIVGQSRALDMILTGRGVGAEEAARIGLADRLVGKGEALDTAVALAAEIAAFPQLCMRSDRLSAHRQWSLPLEAAMAEEFRGGRAVVESGETLEGAQRYVAQRAAAAEARPAGQAE